MRSRRSRVAAAMAVGLSFLGASAQVQRPSLVSVGGMTPESGGAGVRELPYSLVEKTTTVRTLGDGTTMTRVGERRMIRDSEGRVRTESGRIENGEFQVDLAQWNDPATHTHILLHLRSATARVMHFGEPGTRTSEPRTPEEIAAMRERAATARAERLNHSGRMTTEKLGAQSIDGVFAEGTRVTRVIPEGSEGNDREITVVTESWMSPELKILVARTVDDPRIGKSSTAVSDLQRAEPEPGLFQIPANFMVVDQDNGGIPVE